MRHNSESLRLLDKTRAREGGHESSRGLRIVEAPPYYREEVRIWNGDAEENTHSLHHVLPYPGAFRAEIPHHFIQKYTRKGDIVLDPFCGSGTTGFEANMLGRVAYQSDLHPVALLCASAKLEPVDLAEVTLELQVLSLKRPVELGPYREIFSQFYDAETFREIANLRALLGPRTDRVAVFLKLLSASILHGHSAGYLSVYTSNQVALSPEEQAAVNRRRRQIPDYRSVMPRLLRKTASVLRDGVPSIMRQVACQNRVFSSDARDLAGLKNGSVDLIVTGPPLPGDTSLVQQQWLRLWFLGASATSFAGRMFGGKTVQEWLEFMNEVLLDLARVTKSGGRAVLVVHDVRCEGETVMLDEALITMVNQQLSRYWIGECVQTHREKAPAISGSLRARKSEGSPADQKMVVLRRK